MPQENPLNYQERSIPIYYHRSTKNKSFIDMSNYLKSIGVKNNRFMLQLLDPDLAYIDPHDPNLSYRDKIKVFSEVVNNFWYFVREVVRIPTSGTPDRFILNRGNMAYLYLATMNINTILILPRQTGKTIGSCCFYLYIYNFKTRNTTIPLLNKEWKDSKDNLGRIRKIRDLLPTYLRFDSIYSIYNGKKLQVQSNASFMENANNRNKFVTYGKAKNESTAMSLLRGTTIANLWVDEFAFVPFMKQIYGNAAPAMNTAISIAKRNNVPYGVLYTTTPGILTSEEGKYAYNAVQEATRFSEKWYDLSYYQIRDIINSNKFSTFVHVEFSYLELGFDDKWFHNVCVNQNWDWDLIRREYLLEWSTAAEDCPFDKEDLDIILKFCKEPIMTYLVLNKYELKIFEKIPLKANNTPKYPPIIGVDVSGGVSKDYSCLTFIDSRTTRVFAELRSNFISTIELARVIEYIVNNMMPNAIINIERNGVATATSAYSVMIMFPVLIALKKLIRIMMPQRNW